MQNDIDSELCSQILQAITDELASTAPKSASAASLPELIAQVRSVSAAADQRLRSRLMAIYPDIGWRTEETASFNTSQPHWVYDPIDGAYHYLQGLPLWSASLALVQDGIALMAIVYDPALGELFTAQRGAGASCAGKKMHVSSKTCLATTVVGTAIPPRTQVGIEAQAEAFRLLQIVAPNVFVVRPMAATSLQLAYVAAGRLDAYWEIGNDPADWLAGSLLVQEAGGNVTDFQKRPLDQSSSGIVASNPPLSCELLTLINEPTAAPAVGQSAFAHGYSNRNLPPNNRVYK